VKEKRAVASVALKAVCMYMQYLPPAINSDTVFKDINKTLTRYKKALTESAMWIQLDELLTSTIDKCLKKASRFGRFIPNEK
jgi:hypothetical protein